MQPIQMILSTKQKKIINFFLNFGNVEQNLKILEKQMNLVADVFSKLGTANDVVRQMSKKSRFRRNFDKQHGKGPKPCQNLHNSTFIIFIDLFEKIELDKASLSDM